MSVVTITIPKIDGISPTGLKKAIDYLILQQQQVVVSNLTTRVVVNDQAPAKEYRSREYEIVSKETISSGDMAADKDSSIRTQSRVSVNYPEQTFVKVMLHVTNLPKQPGSGDIISMICKEIKQYLSLFNVEVIGPGLTDDIENPDAGLELSVCIPRLPPLLRKELKADIEHIINKARLPSHTPLEATGELPIGKVMKHKLTICDNPNDPRLCMVKISLLGETKRIYYETMWDIHRKVKSYMNKRLAIHSEVDLLSSNNVELLKEVIISLPSNGSWSLFSKVYLHRKDLKQCLVKSLQNEGMSNFELTIKKNNSTSTSYINVHVHIITGAPPCNPNITVIWKDIVPVLTEYLMKFVPQKDKSQICIHRMVIYEPEYKQNIAEGIIHYAIHWYQDKVLMRTTYPEEVNGALQDLDSCSVRFEEGLHQVLSQCDLPQLKTQFEDHYSTCPYEFSAENVEFHFQHLEGFKTIYAHMDSDKSKHEIVQSILLEMCKKING